MALSPPRPPSVLPPLPAGIWLSARFFLLWPPPFSAVTGDGRRVPPTPSLSLRARGLCLGRGGWVPLGRTRPPSRGDTGQVGRAPGLWLRGVCLWAGPAWKVTAHLQDPSPAFSECSPCTPTVALRRPWGHIFRKMGMWRPRPSRQQPAPGKSPLRRSFPLRAAVLSCE